MIELTKENLYFLTDEAKQIDLYDAPGQGGGKAHLDDTLDDYLSEFDGYREDGYMGKKWGYDWSLAEINEALRGSSIRTIKVQFYKGIQYGALFKADGRFFVRKETVKTVPGQPCFYKAAKFYRGGMPIYMSDEANDEDGIWTAEDFIKYCGGSVEHAKQHFKYCLGEDPREII